MESTDFNSVVTMKRPAILAILLFFLLSTAAVAPLAFRIGQAHGGAMVSEMSQNDTFPVAYMDRIRSREGCPLLGRNASLNNRGFIVDCLPKGNGPAFAKTGANKRRQQVRTIFDAPIKRQQTPLDQAVMASLTGQGSGAPSAPDNPLSLAMAPLQNVPSASIFQNSGNFGGGSGFLPGGGLPNNLIPPQGAQPAGPGGNNSIPAASVPTNTGSDPEPPVFVIPDGSIDPTSDPDLVTPIPAALPLMLTGLAGLFATRRRKTTK